MIFKRTTIYLILFLILLSPPVIVYSANSANDFTKEEVEMLLLKHELKTKRLEILFTVVTIVGLSMFLTLLYVDTRRKKRLLEQQKEIAEKESRLLKERKRSVNYTPLFKS